jgi:uncharacterized membrane protein YjfL (UPF0719 family)
MILETLFIPPPWLDPIYFLTSLFWTLIRSFVTFIVCMLFGMAGLKLLDKMTPGISELKHIKGQSTATALFAAGVFVFSALTILGAMTAPLPIGVSSGLGQAVNPILILVYRLLTLLAGFIISILFAFILTRVLAHVEPFGIDLHDAEKESTSIGIYVMGYLIFLGIILYASLLLPA